MKRGLLHLILVVATVSVGLTGSTVLARDRNPQDIVLGAVNIIQPDLFMMEVGATEETPIRRPTVFDTGETLRTNETGVALITWFYDGTETVLGPNSSLALNEFSGGVAGDFVIDIDLKVGHLVSGMGVVAADNEAGTWSLTTPAFSAKLLHGQFEATVDEEGATLLVVTQGRMQVIVDGGEPIVLDQNQFITGTPDEPPTEPQTLSDDGITVNLTGVCTGTAQTNVIVRLAPNENSRNLGTITEGQVVWVRAATEGELWLQIYYQSLPDDPESLNYGWVYGPTINLDEENCSNIMRAALAAHLYGGPGIDKTG